MPDYVFEAGMKQVKARLETITTGNGYQNTVESVQRQAWEGQDVAYSRAIFIKEGAEEQIEQLSSGVNILLRCKRRVNVAIFARPAENDTLKPDEIMNSLAGDVVKALLTPPRTFGGYFEFVTFAERLPLDAEEAKTHLAEGIGIDVFYRYRADDPTLQA